MNQPLSFSDAEHHTQRRKTMHEILLGQMEQVPWKKLKQTTKPFYPKPKPGNVGNALMCCQRYCAKPKRVRHKASTRATVSQCSLSSAKK